MRTVLLASLRTNAQRYIAAAVAVAAAVAFVVVVGVLTAGARAGLMDNAGAPYRGADVVVRAPEDGTEHGPACCPGTLDTAAAVALVDRLGDAASGLGRVMLPAGVGTGGTTVAPIASADALRWQRLVDGRFPAGPGEAVVHVWDARAWGIGVGDRLRVGTGPSAADLAVVGLVESPSTWTQASVYVTWPQYLRWRGEPTFHVGGVAVRGDPGPLPAGMEAVPVDAYVSEGLAGLNNGVDAFGVMLLLFAGVALVVAVLVVANTFAILFAHRLRELALLRCVGATRGQVLGAVRREALVVGTLAAAVGAGLGLGVGYGLLPVLDALAPTTPVGVPAPPVAWVLGGFAAGVLATLVASWAPTRRVVRVSPLAALRPGPTVDVRASARLVWSAPVVLLAGVGLLAAAVLRRDTALMVAGGATSFAGVLLGGPVLVPRLVRATGALFGSAARLATANAVRNPRRTAATTAALLVAVTLTAALLTGTATWRAALDAQRDARMPVDVTLTTLDRPVTADLLAAVRGTPGVGAAVAADGVVGRVSGWDAPVPIVAAVGGVGDAARDGGDFARVEPGTIRLDRDAFRSERTDLAVRPGDRVTVRVGDRTVALTAVLLSGWGQAGLVAPETLAQLTDRPEPHVVFVRAASGADALRLVGDLNGTPGVALSDRLQARGAAERELDILVWSVLALLGVSAAIALLGIGNTLGASVVERADEHLLLRALGLTRGQLRRMLATEAVLMSLVAAVLGTAIGVGFGWVAYEAVVRRALTHATLRVPWPSLAAVVAVTVGAGLLASVLPARRALAATALTRV